jgi:DnaJ-class molecular chaperone
MGTVLVIAAVVAVGYYFSLRIWPERKCRRCSGSGRKFGSTPDRFGRCKKCGGNGRERRPGARMLDQRRRW